MTGNADSSFAVWFSCATLLHLAACGSSDDTAIAPASTDAGADSPESGAYRASTCVVAEVTGAEPVKAEFVTLSPPTVVAPTMSGGGTSGRFRITKARVYLPKETAAFVDLSQSTGTVKGWIAFQGREYRLRTEIDLSIFTTVAGPQEVKETTDSEGTFAVSGANLALQGSPCTTSNQPNAPSIGIGYAFTSIPGEIKLLIRTKSGPTNSDSYTELDGVQD